MQTSKSNSGPWVNLMHSPTHNIHVLLVLPFYPKSSLEMVIKEDDWLMLKLILVEEKYLYTVSILLNFETVTKLSHNFLYSLIYFVQRKIFKFLLLRHAISLWSLHNGKGQFGCISSIFTMYFINRSMNTHMS